ncbi:hypothetical protein [Cohnella faecalis]|uniref:hypothetical protein n=1 Tax=Cohnella faecalis TaxID=2315694 RepID=UPI00131486DD|nr:hypothetical protein [Cohnella faecalis]
MSDNPMQAERAREIYESEEHLSLCSWMTVSRYGSMNLDVANMGSLAVQVGASYE